MSKQNAIHYGQIELMPGIICDGYILDDKTAVMSERGTAKLLGVNQKWLKNVRTNWPPKSITPFLDKGFNVKTNCVKVTANSHHKGRDIIVYTAEAIEGLISSYALALANRALRENQRHIGERCVILLKALVRTALDAAIREACGFIPEVQTTAQKHFVDATKLIQEFGFKCSINKEIATKKDIINFLKVPQSTLNNFLSKHSYEIKPLKLDSAVIKSIGCKARRMNGYHLDDVAKIVFGMDTEIGIELKKKMFGNLGTFAKTHAKDEIQWRNVLSKVFEGFNLQYNHCIGKYRYKIDFFVPELLLCLECNGYSHRYYDPKEEKEREKIITQKYGLIRFHHKVNWEKLVNAILQVKPGKIIKLYDLEKINN